MPAVSVRTVGGQAFTVDVPDDATDADLRRIITETQDYAAHGMRLVCKGKVLPEGKLRDTVTNFAEAKGSLVLVAKKRKAEEAATPPQKAPAPPSPVSHSAPPAAAAAPQQQQQQQAQAHADPLAAGGASPSKPPPAAAEQPAAAAAPAAAVEPTVQMLLDFGMGWTKEQITQALEMAGGNADSASELLLQGLVPVPSAPAPAPAAVVVTPAAQPAAAATAPRPTPPQPAAAAPESDAMQVDDAEDDDFGGGAAPVLSDKPRFSDLPKLTQVCAQVDPPWDSVRGQLANPDTLRRVVLRLRDTHPELHRIVSESHTEMVDLIVNGVPAYTSDEGRGDVVHCTVADMGTIRQLAREFGASEEVAAKAYVSSGRNLGKTAAALQARAQRKAQRAAESGAAAGAAAPDAAAPGAPAGGATGVQQLADLEQQKLACFSKGDISGCRALQVQIDAARAELQRQQDPAAQLALLEAQMTESYHRQEWDRCEELQQCIAVLKAAQK